MSINPQWPVRTAWAPQVDRPRLHLSASRAKLARARLCRAADRMFDRTLGTSGDEFLEVHNVGADTDVN